MFILFSNSNHSYRWRMKPGLGKWRVDELLYQVPYSNLVNDDLVKSNEIAGKSQS